MPLRDHFHPPFSTRCSWDVVHGGLPMVIATHLNSLLPGNYSAWPRISINSLADPFLVDAAPATPEGWTPPPSTLTADADWKGVDDYEVNVYDVTRSRELVAAVEIVSPSNKDRPAHRTTFATKCAALLANDVSVTVIDFVTERESNLYAELLGVLNATDPNRPTPPEPIYAVACRRRRIKRKRKLEAWYHPLVIGQPLPTLPLWLTETLAVPLELEPLYEQTLRSLRIR